MIIRISTVEQNMSLLNGNKIEVPFFPTALLRYSSYSIKFTLLKCSVRASQYVHEAVQPSPPMPEYFVVPRGSSRLSSHHSRPSPSPSDTALLSTDLPVLSISYEWGRVMCGLSCPASCSQHSVIKIRRCRGVRHCLGLLADSAPPRVGVAGFAFPSSTGRHPDRFHF